MKAKRFSEGNSINYTATADLEAGAVVVIGEIVGITTYPVVSGSPCALAVEGIFEIAKDSSAITAGAKVYWNGTAVTTTAEGGTACGHAVATAGADDAAVLVKINF